MKGHTIQPRRTGKQTICVTVLSDGERCGRPVQLVRHRVRHPFWRHTSGMALFNLWRANSRRRIE